MGTTHLMNYTIEKSTWLIKSPIFFTIYIVVHPTTLEASMSGSSSVTLTVCGTGATFDEASASLAASCAAYLRDHSRNTSDNSAGDSRTGSTTSKDEVSAALLAELEELLARRRWPVESWRDDLRLWVSAWKPKSREITKYIVSDYPRNGRVGYRRSRVPHGWPANRRLHVLTVACAECPVPRSAARDPGRAELSDTSLRHPPLGGRSAS